MIGKLFNVICPLRKIFRVTVGLHFSEIQFSYMLLQAYDFAVLNNRGVEMQVGGSDQWGNMMSGMDLCRIMNRSNVQCMTFPLLLKSDGSKMGKTESGTVWLSGAKTTAFAFYQYWFNIDDRDLDRCLKMLTELTPVEIDELKCTDARRRLGQKKLAEEVTRIVHGQQGLDLALAATRVFFGDQFDELTDGCALQAVQHVTLMQGRDKRFTLIRQMLGQLRERHRSFRKLQA